MLILRAPPSEKINYLKLQLILIARLAEPKAISKKSVRATCREFETNFTKNIAIRASPIVQSKNVKSPPIRTSGSVHFCF